MVSFLITSALGIFLFWLVIAFNRLVRVHNLVKEAWANIDVQLKRRHDLIPKLVETVKGYQAHERGVQVDVANLRAHLEKGDLPDITSGENSASLQIRGLLALAEAYPDLKANQNFLALQDKVSEVEDVIQKARRYYNGAIRDNNVMVQSVPGRWIAPRVGITSLPFFELESAVERESPAVPL